MSIEKEDKNVEGPIQIVKINESGDGFVLLEERLHSILNKVDDDMKVSIVSVVGAFRTGKSFILDLFLRYLRYTSNGVVLPDNDHEWILTGAGGNKSSKIEGNVNVGQEGGSSGFSWRAGPERNTTGIWMWGDPFIRTTSTGEQVALFLVDTQGMFDSETSQMLTASIFGLSTLLSSYQIYNVTKQVQEDNLQHLALFSEYGRMALKGGIVEDAGNGAAPKDAKVQRLNSADLLNMDVDEKDASLEENVPRPFQWLEFLVRDWQNFDDDHSIEQKLLEMEEYRDTVLSSKHLKDLANTREQIFSCFEKLTCWLLPHPGKEVTKPKYDGSVDKIDSEFLELLSVYVSTIFSKRVFPKSIHGKPVNAKELFQFIRVYVELFTKATLFPEAKTLLEATAEANNVNSKARALLKYKSEMNKIAGSKCNYIEASALQSHGEDCKLAAVLLFDNCANMGRRSQILAFRKLLIAEIDDEFCRFESLNNERDPWKNLEVYIIPGLFALALVVVRFIGDLFCYDEVGFDLPMYDCKHVSHGLSHGYWAVFTFMIIMAMATGQVVIGKIKLLVTLLQNKQETL